HDKVCGALPPNCTATTVRTDSLAWTDVLGFAHSCDDANYATCVKCTDPNGGPRMGHCVGHPDHCNGSPVPWILESTGDRGRCLAACSTGIMNAAYAALGGVEIKTFSGDFNCIPPSEGVKCDGGGISIAKCPWLDDANRLWASLGSAR